MKPVLRLGFVALALAAVGSAPAVAQEDAGPAAFPFKEGDVVTHDKVDALRPYLPAEFWQNREFFFYEGMQLEIGPSHFDYSPAAEYQAATAQYKGQSKIGPDGALENYTAGQPFPQDEIDCTSDPSAGVKTIWNFDYRWNGDGGDSSFYYSYWDRGEELPLFYEGQGRGIQLAHRVEAEHLKERDGDMFRSEKRKQALGVDVVAPYDARGIALITYRYKSSDGKLSDAQNDDTWVYVPTLRRVRRISSAQRTDAISGTDFTFDDLFSFAGIPPQYDWQCLGEVEVVAPMNSQVAAYPFEKDHNFGPYGLSFASDRWELRKAVKLRMTPKNADHPYHHKDIYLDKQSLEPLYSFAYDQKEELWKIIWHNKRWSETPEPWSGKAWYTGWEGVETPRDLRVVADIIVNVQTGTGNRIEIWDSNGMPLKSKGRVRKYIDVGRLTRGR